MDVPTFCAVLHAAGCGCAFIFAPLYLAGSAPSGFGTCELGFVCGGAGWLCRAELPGMEAFGGLHGVWNCP